VEKILILGYECALALEERGQLETGGQESPLVRSVCLSLDCQQDCS